MNQRLHCPKWFTFLTSFTPTNSTGQGIGQCPHFMHQRMKVDKNYMSQDQEHNYTVWKKAQFTQKLVLTC